MNKLLFLLALLSPFSSFALDEEIKVTSFLYTGTRTRAAEICGVVKNFKGEPKLLKIKVDPYSKKYATYYTTAAGDGKFCAVVMTYSGRAEVTFSDKKQEKVPQRSVWDINSF